MTLQEAFIVVGALLVFAGLALRNRGEIARGVAVAAIVVGVLCVMIGPTGRRFGLW